jgi:gas vesicle protein
MRKVSSNNIVRHLCFALLLCAFTVSPFAVDAQEKTVEVPGSIQEVREGIEGIGGNIFKGLLRAIADLWKEKVLATWKSMWQWTAEEVWQKRIEPAVQSVIDRSKELLGQEVDRRKPVIEQQLQEEKQELQDQGKRTGKGLWERFLDLFRQ